MKFSLPRFSLLFVLMLLWGCKSTPLPEEKPEVPKAAHSKLWGREGEFWLQAGRLPDFSYAGYRSGEKPIPDHPIATSVDAFGARGDDNIDDTEAFKAALAATQAGAIVVPPGRYIINAVLRITRPGVVLRGAGAERTTLFFPRPLEAIEPNHGETTSGQATSNYSWSGGFVRLQGNFGADELTPITAGAQRGDRVITVGKPQALAVGQVVQVWLTDTPENTLAQHLYSDDAGDTAKLNGKTSTSLVTKITQIDGDRIQLERRLRFDVRPEWRPVVRAFVPTVTDSGVEDLTFAFPETPYGGHFTEQGFNPVAFVNVAHCWARRLRFINPESGPMVGGVFNTVSDVVFESKRATDKHGNQGHHGIYLQRLGDHLFTRFDIRMRFVHDISVSGCAGVVVSQGKGVDLCFDNHKRAPYETLFTAIDVGKGTRPWKSGGGDALGKHAGARITFWNIRAAGPLAEPPKAYAPWSMNLVGVDLGRPGVAGPMGTWQEFSAGEVVYPMDLHASQLARRLSGAGAGK
ncbi:MAG: Pectate lyase superfamily protein [Rariglobus sp.]|jgi:hypothetical protein|nr:Pectate lyase superfamily protein [Rariglobus sp.]